MKTHSSPAQPLSVMAASAGGQPRGRAGGRDITAFLSRVPLVCGENSISPRNSVAMERHGVPLYDGHITAFSYDVFVTTSLYFGDESGPFQTSRGLGCVSVALLLAEKQS